LGQPRNQNFGVVFIRNVGYVQVMMRGGKILVCVVSAFAAGTMAKALVADAPGTAYQGIVDRNVFALKPPPPPVPVEPPKPPAPNITLTGITTILGRKQALMKAQVSPKPGEPAKEVSYILTEGQRDGDVEVIAINEKAGTVKVNNQGVIQELNFEKNGVKLPSTPPPAGSPGASAGSPLPSFSRPTPGSPLKSIPTRSLRLPSSAGGRSGAGLSPSGGGESGPGGTGSASATPGTAGAQSQGHMNSEELRAHLDAQREKYKGTPMERIIPPTPPSRQPASDGQ
jgi:hypothetical protein